MKPFREFPEGKSWNSPPSPGYPQPVRARGRVYTERRHDDLVPGTAELPGWEGTAGGVPVRPAVSGSAVSGLSRTCLGGRAPCPCHGPCACCQALLLSVRIALGRCTPGAWWRRLVLSVCLRVVKSVWQPCDRDVGVSPKPGWGSWAASRSRGGLGDGAPDEGWGRSAWWILWPCPAWTPSPPPRLPLGCGRRNGASAQAGVIVGVLSWVGFGVPLRPRASMSLCPLGGAARWGSPGAFCGHPASWGPRMPRGPRCVRCP